MIHKCRECSDIFFSKNFKMNEMGGFDIVYYKCKKCIKGTIKLNNYDTDNIISELRENIECVFSNEDMDSVTQLALVSKLKLEINRYYP